MATLFLAHYETQIWSCQTGENVIYFNHLGKESQGDGDIWVKLEPIEDCMTFICLSSDFQFNIYSLRKYLTVYDTPPKWFL
jgi:hypothetical protein